MKRPPGLAIDATLVNSNHSQQDDGHPDMGTTYRQEGLSIGRDYLRFEGSTITRGGLQPSALSTGEIIGRGACSIVQRAVWHNGLLEKVVAVKQFPLGCKNRRKMLIKELRALCKVDCDCLLHLMGAFLEHNTVTMVLEFMDRGSIVDLFKGGPRGDAKCETQRGLPEQIVAAIAYQVLRGLSYLHHDRTVHRDVKASNILLHSNGFVKLADFGISSQNEKDGALNTTMVGTSCYMSPERLNAKLYGSSSDMWSFGLVLLECVTGKAPWEGVNSLIELVVTIEEATIDELTPDDASEYLREVLAACLQKTPEKRMPAHILMESPWFPSHGIRNVADSTRIMRQYYEEP